MNLFHSNGRKKFCFHNEFLAITNICIIFELWISWFRPYIYLPSCIPLLKYTLAICQYTTTWHRGVWIGHNHLVFRVVWWPCIWRPVRFVLVTCSIMRSLGPSLYAHCSVIGWFVVNVKVKATSLTIMSWSRPGHWL